MTQAPVTNLSPAEIDDALDPELLDLPAPPKRERTLTVAMLLVTGLASLAMVGALRRDAAYAFGTADARDVGELGAASTTAAFVDNTYVRGDAMLGAAHAIKFERPLVPGSFRLMPVSGRDNVWIEVRVPAGAETNRYVPPSQFSGRLVRFETAGPKHRGLADAIQATSGRAVPKDAWLLVDSDAPSTSRWAVLLVAMFVGFAVWNAAVTAKLLKRVT